MNSKFLIRIVWLALAPLLLVACGSLPGAASGPATPTAVPVVVTDSEIVAEGRLVPRETTQLSFFTSGQLAEVLVKQGDQVKAGDVVARLGNRESLESAIANAEMELLSAQQALKKLDDDLPQAQTEALQAFNDARDALRDAERRVSRFDVPAQAIDIEVARANVALALKTLDKAKKDYKPYKNKPESDLRRAGLLNKLSEAQDRYDEAVRKLNQLEGTLPTDFEMEQARTELSIAQSQLKLAQDRHELLKQGPDPDQVAAAQARITSAEAALASAKAALNNLELVATIDGTIVNMDLIVGQQVTAGQPVVDIADFSSMYAETDDLTEIEVVDIAAGQKAQVVPDALPQSSLNGTVETISKTYEEKRGDVTYTARILLDQLDPRLRWGMTVAITFEK